MAINKIIKLGLEEEANALKSQGLSDSQIAKELSDKSGEKVNRQNVWNYFRKNSDQVVKNVKNREEIVSKAVSNRLETAEQLERINKAALYILKEALQSAEYNVALKAIREVTNQLELQSKIIGDIQTGDTYNYNYFDVKFQEVKKIIFEEVSDDEARARITERFFEVLAE